MILNIRGLDQPEAIDLQESNVLAPPSRSQPPSLRLHGRADPKVEIQKEKAIHRTAAYMMASGAKFKTIAFELGVTEATVGNWAKQIWFQQLVTTIIHNEFNDDISKLLKAAAVESVLTIRDLATNGVNESTKLKAAQDLLDRYRGKATNFVHHTNGSLSEKPEEELKRLEEELLTNG